MQLVEEFPFITTSPHPNLHFNLKGFTMLVLSRKEGEKLVIGDNVVVTINRIAGNRVAVGIEAPREVSITRGELTRKVSSASKSAVKGSPSAAAMMLEAEIAVASQLDR